MSITPNRSGCHIHQGTRRLTEGIGNRLWCRRFDLNYRSLRCHRINDLTNLLIELHQHVILGFHRHQAAPRAFRRTLRLTGLDLQGTGILLSLISHHLRLPRPCLQGTRLLLGLIGIALRLLLLNLPPDSATGRLQSGTCGNCHDPPPAIPLPSARSGDDVDQRAGALPLRIGHRLRRLFGAFDTLLGTRLLLLLGLLGLACLL
jgi:hypothetical protein